MVSIIVPTYNLQEYIGNCLNSLMNQEYRDIEIIVVDDGSNDNTIDVIRQKQTIDPRIKLFCQENGGAAKARNCGLRNSSGKYIMFVDGDDMLSRDTIQSNIGYLEDDMELDWVAFSIVRTDKNGVPLHVSGIYSDHVFSDNNIVTRDKFVPYFYNHRLSGVCCGALYRTSSIKDISFPDGEYYEDGFFFTDLLCHTSKGLLSKHGAYFYVHRPESSQLKALDDKHLQSDLKCATKRLRQYRNEYPQFEDIYREWESRLYYYYKNEVAKETEGASCVFNEFISNMRSKPKINYKTEAKLFIYRLLGYRNIVNTISWFHKKWSI